MAIHSDLSAWQNRVLYPDPQTNVTRQNDFGSVLRQGMPRLLPCPHHLACLKTNTKLQCDQKVIWPDSPGPSQMNNIRRHLNSHKPPAEIEEISKLRISPGEKYLRYYNAFVAQQLRRVIDVSGESVPVDASFLVQSDAFVQHDVSPATAVMNPATKRKFSQPQRIYPHHRHDSLSAASLSAHSLAIAGSTTASQSIISEDTDVFSSAPTLPNTPVPYCGNFFSNSTQKEATPSWPALGTASSRPLRPVTTAPFSNHETNSSQYLQPASDHHPLGQTTYGANSASDTFTNNQYPGHLTPTPDPSQLPLTSHLCGCNCHSPHQIVSFCPVCQFPWGECICTDESGAFASPFAAFTASKPIASKPIECCPNNEATNSFNTRTDSDGDRILAGHLPRL